MGQNPEVDQGFDSTETDAFLWEYQTVLVNAFLGSHAGQDVLLGIRASAIGGFARLVGLLSVTD